MPDTFGDDGRARGIGSHVQRIALHQGQLHVRHGLAVARIDHAPRERTRPAEHDFGVCRRHLDGLRVRGRASRRHDVQNPAPGYESLERKLTIRVTHRTRARNSPVVEFLVGKEHVLDGIQHGAGNGRAGFVADNAGTRHDRVHLHVPRNVAVLFHDIRVIRAAHAWGKRGDAIRPGGQILEPEFPVGIRLSTPTRRGFGRSLRGRPIHQFEIDIRVGNGPVLQVHQHGTDCFRAGGRKRAGRFGRRGLRRFGDRLRGFFGGRRLVNRGVRRGCP